MYMLTVTMSMPLADKNWKQTSYLGSFCLSLALYASGGRVQYSYHEGCCPENQ